MSNNIIEFHGGGGGGHHGGGGGGHHGHFGHFGGRHGRRYAGWGPGNYTYSNNSWIDNGGYYYPYYSSNWDDPYDIVDIQETTYPPHDVKENYEKSCNCCNSGGGNNYWAMLLSLLIFLALVYLVYTQIA